MPVTLKSKRLVAAALIVVCLRLLGGCEGPASIVGKWRVAAGSNEMVWEFLKDGSVLIGNERGRYSFGDGRRVKIATPFATAVYRAEISRETMILTDPNGSRLQFTRMK